jgi:hypothetical protein
MHLKTLFFLFYFRASADPPSTNQHRHVSLANIATAFLSERKSSSRRQSSGRRKKRSTIKGKKTSNPRYKSGFSTTTDGIKGQRISLENMDGGIATIFMTSMAATGANNKHRSATVIIFDFFI